MNIDATDNKIINLLKYNAQYTSAELAEKIGISGSTVRRRIKRMIDLKIIRMATIPDHEKIGRPVLVVISFEVMHNRIGEVLDKIGEFENCTWVAVVTGRFNILSLWRFSSHEEIDDFLEVQLSNVEGITSIETAIGLRMGKHP